MDFIYEVSGLSVLFLGSVFFGIWPEIKKRESAYAAPVPSENKPENKPEKLIVSSFLYGKIQPTTEVKQDMMLLSLDTKIKVKLIPYAVKHYRKVWPNPQNPDADGYYAFNYLSFNSIFNSFLLNDITDEAIKIYSTDKR